MLQPTICKHQIYPAPKTVLDIDVKHKTALVRIDLKVHPDWQGKILDDSPLRASLPTIKYLLEHQARVILCSHFGRPQGQIVESLRLAPLAARLSSMLGKPVRALPEGIGPAVEKARGEMMDGQVVLLENLAFYPQEAACDPEFARALARLGEVLVNEAFDASQRETASLSGVARFLPAVAGLSLAQELTFLGDLLMRPEPPFSVLLGGASVTHKLALLQNLPERVDTVLIGGGLIAPFLQAQGYSVGCSPVKEDQVELCRKILRQAKSQGVYLVLPSDVIVYQKRELGLQTQVCSVKEIPESGVIVDIGPETIRRFTLEINVSSTILWSGALGLAEQRAFSTGTRCVARALAACQRRTVVAGASAVAAVSEMGLREALTHVSVSGEASQAFLEGLPMPGISVLPCK